MREKKEKEKEKEEDEEKKEKEEYCRYFQRFVASIKGSIANWVDKYQNVLRLLPLWLQRW